MPLRRTPVLAGAPEAKRPKYEAEIDPLFGWPLDEPPPAPDDPHRPPPDPQGGTMVREPRRPKPNPPLAGAVELALPDDLDE